MGRYRGVSFDERVHLCGFLRPKRGNDGGWSGIQIFLSHLVVSHILKVLCGLPWGVFATLGPAYASEVCPTNLRGYLTTYVNLCWATGQFIAAGVLYACLLREDQWAYRIPFAVQ